MTNHDLDPIKETITIGAGNAATALSKLLNHEVNFSVPDVELLPLEKAQGFIGSPEEIKTVILLKLSGDAQAIMVYLFDPAEAIRLTEFLTHNHSENLDKKGRSALTEMVNIMAGNSIKAVSDFVAINFIQSVPDIATDMVGASLDSVFATLGKEFEDIVIIAIDFTIVESKTVFRSLFLTDTSLAHKLLDASQKRFLAHGTDN